MARVFLTLPRRIYHAHRAHRRIFCRASYAAAFTARCCALFAFTVAGATASGVVEKPALRTRRATEEAYGVFINLRRG